MDQVVLILIDDEKYKKQGKSRIDNLLLSLWIQGYKRQNIYTLHSSFSQKDQIRHIIDKHGHEDVVFGLLQNISQYTLFLQGPEILKSNLEKQIIDSAILIGNHQHTILFGYGDKMLKYLNDQQVFQVVNHHNIIAEIDLTADLDYPLQELTSKWILNGYRQLTHAHTNDIPVLFCLNGLGGDDTYKYLIDIIYPQILFFVYVELEFVRNYYYHLSWKLR